MIILPNLPTISVIPAAPENVETVLPLPNSVSLPMACPDDASEAENEAPDALPQEEVLPLPNFWDVTSGNVLTLTDVPPLVITNSFDDEDEEDEMEDMPDEEDEDIYREVDAFEDFDDEFDEDFEDEFDEDYEDLARIDDEDLEVEEDAASTPSRYEEEFGDVDGQAKFIPDGGMPLNEEVLLSEDDLEESDASDFDDFTDDDEGEEFNEYDNEI